MEKRPKYAGLGHSHFLSLSPNSQSLSGVLFVVTTRNRSNSPAYYGRYVNTPIEGIALTLGCVFRCVSEHSLTSIAVPLLGTGYANVSYLDKPERAALLRKAVVALTIRELEQHLINRDSKLRRGIIVLYSQSPNSEEEHQLWDFVIRFISAKSEKRLASIDVLVQDLQ